jgi:fructan beta-fructosidase
VDYGPDFYAAISWNNLPESDGRRLWIGWMSNWMYANQEPTAPWRTAQSVPRSVHLRTVGGRIRMVQNPVEELTRLRRDHVRLSGVEVAPGLASLGDRGIRGKTLELRAEFEAGDAEAFGFKVRVGPEEETIVGYDRRSQMLFVDRTNAGEDDFHARFAARHEAPFALIDGKLRLHVLVDWSSVEVFANDGTVVFTSRIFPEPASDGVAVFSEGGTARLVSLDAWNLASIWDPMDRRRR